MDWQDQPVFSLGFSVLIKASLLLTLILEACSCDVTCNFKGTAFYENLLSLSDLVQ